MSSPGVPPDTRLPDDGFGAPREQTERVVDTPSQDRPNRERGLAQKYSNAGQITTLMLRNIPSMYTQDMLLEEIVDCMGSSDIFDFFYLPWDLQNDCNVGYAFVNFRDVASAERCTRIFTNFNFRKFDSRRTCKVYPAHIQGLENNLRHLMDRAVSEARAHYPIIMWKGEKLKLGKVIEALHGQKTAPQSAPGKPLGDTFRGDTMSVPSWPPPQHQAYTGPNSSTLDTVSGLLADSDQSPFGGDCYSPTGHMVPPASGPPPGLVAPPLSSSGRGPGMHAPEVDMLKALPELRAVISQGMRKNPVHTANLMAPREPGIQPPQHGPPGHAPHTVGANPGHMVVPASMPGRMPSASGPFAPSLPARPPSSTGINPGRVGGSPQYGGCASAASSGPIVVNAFFGGAADGSPAAATVGPNVFGPGPIIMEDADAGVAPNMREIGIRDPDFDVLQKFCQKFSA